MKFLPVFARRLLTFLLLYLVVIGHPMAAGQRLALVIGNAAYTDGPLKNPVNDARAIDQKLTALGFKVQRIENMKRQQIGRTITAFASVIRPGDEVVVFYAGHGVQVKGVNYLPVVDADIQSEDDVALNSLNLNSLMERLDEAKAGLKLLFLDACRNNPYARSFRSGDRGLARVSAAPSGTLIHFATRPGSVAADGSGANGLYTSQLLRYMDAPNVPVEAMLKRVSAAVETASKGAQEPWTEGSIRGEFYFKAGAGIQVASVSPEPTGRPPQSDPEEDAWQATKVANTTVAYDAYLSEYPRGRYASAARVSRAGAQAVAPPPVDAEDRWKRVLEFANGASDVQSYLDQHPGKIDALKALAQKGDAQTQGQLARMYTNGWGVEKNHVQALALARKAAALGNSDGQVVIGTIYFNGWGGVSKDQTAAVDWYRKAADQGNVRGQLNLANNYANGSGGLAKDESEAIKWYRKAADQGNAFAQNRLGVAYALGNGGVSQNEAEALKWYRKAADQGEAYAQNNLGFFYARGLGGLSQDETEAIKWIRKAADQGHAGAVAELKRRGLASASSFTAAPVNLPVNIPLPKEQPQDAPALMSTGLPDELVAKYQMSSKAAKVLRESDLFRFAPRAKSVDVRIRSQIETEYTGSQSRSLPKPAAYSSEENKKIRPAGSGCVMRSIETLSNMAGATTTSRMENASCGGFVALGNFVDGKQIDYVTDLEVKGSVFPMRVGASISFLSQHGYLADRNAVFKSANTCTVEGEGLASELHASLTGKAWRLRCEGSYTYNGTTTANQSTTHFLEDIGLLSWEIGVIDFSKKNFVFPNLDFVNVMNVEGDYGSRVTTRYPAYEVRVLP